MADLNERKLIGKVGITLSIKCLTGLHIGASKENLEIGALDSPVVRDPITKQPYIPGSSLKGKLRTLVEKAYGLPANRRGGVGRSTIFRHECDTFSNAKKCPVCGLFGSTGRGDNGSNYPAKIRVRDSYLTKTSLGILEKIDTGLLYTEWKFENALDRVTSAANPRNLERVPKGACFETNMVYDVENLTIAKEDMENLGMALRLLEDDALGGHGSRGYGQVEVKVETIKPKTLEDYAKGAEPPKEKIIKDLTQIEELIRYFPKS